MSSTTYTIERAKTGRSACKKCKEKIGKGELRLGVLVEKEPYNMQSWYHPACFTLPRKLKSEGITAESFVHDMLEDASKEQDILSNSNQVQELIAQIGAKPDKKAAIKGEDGTGGGGSNKIDRIKANLLSAGNDENEPPKKKIKLSKDDMEEMDLYNIYRTHNIDGLKDFMRWNNQQVSGTKDLLLVKCIDGHKKGRLGLCPSCEKGRLKIDNVQGEQAICNGYYDEDMATRIPCTYKMPLSEAPRFHPWYTEKPSEEEMEEMKQMTKPSSGKGAASGGSLDGDIADATTKLCNLVESKVEWNVDNLSGIKKTNLALLDLCSTFDGPKLDIPDGKDGKKKMGKLLLENKSLAPSDFVNLLIETFGFAKVKDEKKKAKQESLASGCRVPANAAVLSAMMELREFYFKEKNANAGKTYDKVANAIKDLDFEITADNAKGLGKGKTKVAGIGKGSADKIFDIVTTGTTEKLEEKRAAHK